MAQATLKPESGSKARRKFARVRKLLKNTALRKDALIPILQKVQEEYRYLPEEILTFVATALDLPPATVYGVATFYAQFSLEPKGKYLIKVCDGTACHVRKNQPIINELKKRLKLSDGQKTTPDMRYTLEIVSCIGACALAPAVVVNGTVYGQMTPEKVNSVIDEIEAAENAEEKR